MTDFETYIINLKKNIHKFNNLKKILLSVGIAPIRFDAIYGKMITDFDKYDNFITEYCRYFCPKGVIGCGLSHYILLNNIYRRLMKGDNNEFTLILEDDVTPRFKDKKEIIDIIDHIPKNCNILMLYCFGICPYEGDLINNTSENGNDINININHSRYIKAKSRFFGSTAAYLIRNSAIPKLLKNRLFYHVDMQWYNILHDTVYIYYRPLFYTDDSSSDVHEINYNTLGLEQLNYFFPVQLHNITTQRVLTYPIIRIPFLDVTINSLNIIQIMILFIILLFMYQIVFKNINKS